MDTVASMPNANAPETAVRREDLPLADRLMELRSFVRRETPAGDGTDSGALATAELVFTTGAPVRRYDWANGRYYVEELVVEPGAIRLGRLQAGAPLLNTHDDWDLESVLGVVDAPAVAGGEGTCNVTFSRRPSVAGYVQDVEDKIIRNVSVGYARHRIEMIAPDTLDGTWRYRVTDWEPFEVSLVPIPADVGAQVRGGGTPDESQRRDRRSFPCDFIEVRTAGLSSSAPGGRSPQEQSMPQSQAAGGTHAPATETRAQQPAEGTPANTTAFGGEISEVQRAAAEAERTRAAAITELCTHHNVGTLAPGLVRGGSTVDQARAAVLDELARRDAASGGHRNTGTVRTVTDETETRMAGIREALLHRVDPRATLTDNGRQYRGMSLLELGREHLERSGVNTRGMDRMTLASTILQFRSGGAMATSDFANVLAAVANKRLRGAYDENPGTYSMWARRAPNAPDFKTMNVIQIAGAPDLLKVNEHGEFKYGAMTDGKETYAITTYGRIVSLTRQALINDDLRAFDRLVGAFGGAARRLENRTVYAQLTANANMGDGVAMFHATHGNVGTGAGSALQLSSLTTMRTAMRKQKGLQGEELNVIPGFLIVPAALEQTAYQLTSSQYVPNAQGSISEFRQGGRTALEPVVEPVLDADSATKWYAAASSSQIDTVEYCYLDGADGPVIEQEVGFEIDGISLKCRNDFAAKAIDWRGLYRADGA